MRVRNVGRIRALWQIIGRARQGFMSDGLVMRPPANAPYRYPTRPAAVRAMLTASVLTVTALSPMPAAVQAAPTNSLPDYSAIIGDFRASIPKLMRAENVPGVSIAVVDRERVLWIESFGYTDDDHRCAVTPNTVFSVQSMSKNFTSAAVLAAVQEGLVDLDTPIKEYLPGFSVNSRYDAHPEEKITLRMLLSHHAGFTHEAPVGNNYDGDAASFEQHIASISGTWLRFPVGQLYSYSNLGVDLAGYILQVRSGMPFAQYVKQKVFDRAGMTASTFDMKVIRANHSRAIGHSSLPKETPEVPMVPSGGLYTSAMDLARWVQLQLNAGKAGGSSVVHEDLMRAMATIQFRLPRQTAGYGFGIAAARRHGMNILSHGGGGFGFLSTMTWYPEAGIGIGMLTNSYHSFQFSLPNDVLDRFVEAGLGHKLPDDDKPQDAPGQSVSVPMERLRKYAGEYFYNRGGSFVLSLQGGKLGFVDGKQFVPMTWASENEGYMPIFGGRFFFRFEKGADGQAPYAVRLNDGECLDYNSGPTDPAGPNRTAEWSPFLGKYGFEVRGQGVGSREATMLAGRRRGRRRLCLLHVFHVAEQGAPVVETVAAFHVVAAAGDRVVVLVYVAVLLPLLQEQLIGLLREVASHLGVVVVAQTKVDQIVHGTPDSATPVVLIGKSGIVARDGGNNPLTPELAGVEQVLLNHGLRLGGRGGARQQRIEVGGRKPVAELTGVQVLVQKDAVRLAP